MSIKPLSNEKDLLKKIADGDSFAFAELFRAYNEPLAKYVYTLLESVEMCEEVVQDIFIKIWENRQELPYLEKFTSYLFILTRNHTVSSIRKMIQNRKYMQQYIEDIVIDSTTENIFSADQEYQDTVARAVLQLPPSQQTVLMLRQQGLKTYEIAERMGISRDSVKKYQQWASHSVSKFLKSHILMGAFFLFIRRH
ncbi:RNA polymerase sigma factor [Pedobacter sp. R-06]|uniref:RNA polymerase sigma factor n=1 Tax=Pedobacter sp. R-06 TaxID=3404051 RepID=UPI003CE6B8C3